MHYNMLLLSNLTEVPVDHNHKIGKMEGNREAEGYYFISLWK
jgi:hypothetical protein